jgi:hypothetical protein
VLVAHGGTAAVCSRARCALEEVCIMMLSLCIIVYPRGMRTTVTLDDDVVKALEALRRERGLGTSAALNELVRRGLAVPAAGRGEPFRQRTSTMGPSRVPLDDIGAALELLEGDGHR